MNIPLINTNGVNDINTSIIAIKRQEEQLSDLIKVANNKIAEADNKIKLLNNLLDSLNLSEVGGGGKFIQSIAQEKGLLSASAGDIATSVESGNSNPVTSGAVANALSDKLDNSITIIQGTEVNNISTEVLSVYGVKNYDIGWISNDGMIMTIPWNNNNYGFQIAFDDQSNWLAIRSKQNGNWNGWERIYQGYQLNPITNFSYTMRSGYSGNMTIEVTNFQCSGINVFQLTVSNLSGSGIGTTATIKFADCNLRPKQDTMAIGFDYVTGQAVRMCIYTDGSVSLQESYGVNNGNNQIRIVFTMLF